MSTNTQLKSDLTLHWVITGTMLVFLLAYNSICYFWGSEIQIEIAEDQRLFLRTCFYVIAIILFPVTNLLRFILLRLNHTMPGDKIAKARYFTTVLVTTVIIEMVGVFGFILFIVGDEINSLYIFNVLALLGIFLHRPKLEEYQLIVRALEDH